MNKIDSSSPKLKGTLVIFNDPYALSFLKAGQKLGYYYPEQVTKIFESRENEHLIQEISRLSKIEFKKMSKELERLGDKLRHKLEGKIRPTWLPLNLHHLIYELISNKVDQLMIRVPEKVEISKRFNSFKGDFAEARAESAEQLTKTILEFINYVEDELKLIGEFDDDSLIDRSTVENLWRDVISNDFAMDINLAYLLGTKRFTWESQPIAIDVPILHVKEAYDLCLEKMRRELRWFIDKTEGDLRPFIGMKAHPLFNPSKKLMGSIDVMRLLLSRVDTLFGENLEELLKKLEMAKKLLCQFRMRFADSEDYAKYPSFVDLPDMTKYLSIICDDAIKNNKEQNCTVSLKDYQNKDLLVDGELTTVSFGENVPLDDWSIEELKKLIEFGKVRERWPEYGDAYINSVITALLLGKIIPTLENWAKNKTESEIKKLFEPKLPIKPTPQKQQEPQKQDPLFSNKGKKTKPKSSPPPKRKPRISEEEKVDLDVPSKESTIPESKKIQQQSPSSISKELKIEASQSLSSEDVAIILNLIDMFEAKEISKVSTQAAKSFRHFFMYMVDMLIIQNRLSDIDEALGASLKVGSSYHVLEQLLRYLKFSEDKEITWDSVYTQHNLQGLYLQLASKDSKIPEIVKQLRLGTYWNHSTFSQASKLMDLFPNRKLPTVLTHLLTLAQKPNSDKVQEAKIELSKLGQQTLDVSKTCLPLIFEKSKTMLLRSWETITLPGLDLKEQISIHTLNSLKEGIAEMEKRLSVPLSHPIRDRFKQLQKDILILSATIEILNKPMPSDELSLFVRTAVYWQNRMMENLLKAITEQKTGVGSNDAQHDLVVLFKDIWKKDTDSKELKFLESHYPMLNNLSRYPFEPETGKGEIHEAILHAERLRLHPEIEKGFEVKGNRLNPIVLSSDNGNYAGIMKTLAAFLGESSVLMEKLLYPELKRVVKDISK